MIVLNLSNCPIGLRGDLTKWLLEISSGVFVGQVSARVRDELWDRVKQMCKSGCATLVFSAQGEQHLDFRVHGDVWEPIDFDGIKLMLRPSPSRLKAKRAKIDHGFSDAAKRRAAKRFTSSKVSYPSSFVSLEIATAGKNPEKDEILELRALKAVAHKAVETFHFKLIPIGYVELIGHVELGDGAIAVADDSAANVNHSNGKALSETLTEFFSFLGDMPIVAHDTNASVSFLLHGCAKCNLPLFTNRCIDTLALARRTMPLKTDFSLEVLAAKLGITPASSSHSFGVCETIMQLYEKLIKATEAESDR